MKRILLTGAAIGALVVGAQAADLSGPIGYVPAPEAEAVHRISGDLAFYAGFGSWSGGDEDDKSFNSFPLGGQARANVWIRPNISAQFDFSGENGWTSDDEDNECKSCNYSVLNGAVHLSHRNMDYLMGAFASVGYNGWWGERFGTLGVEGQTNLGPVRVYGQGGYTTDLTDGGQTSAWYIHGEGRYFVNPNLAIAANVGFADTEEYGTDINVLRWGADIEGKLNDSPFGAFLSYQGSREDEEGHDEAFVQHTVLGGIKLHFNNDDLESADARLSDFNPFTGVNHVRFYDAL